MDATQSLLTTETDLVKRGKCPQCGVRTHNVGLLGFRRRALTDPGRVVHGRCLTCPPLGCLGRAEDLNTGRGNMGGLISIERKASVPAGRENTSKVFNGKVSLLSAESISTSRASRSKDSPESNRPVAILAYNEQGHLTKQTLGKDTDLSCCICGCERMQMSRMASISGCQHLFCFGCISRWAEFENSCPLCKNSFSEIVSCDLGQTLSQLIKFVPHRKQPLQDNISFFAFTSDSENDDNPDSEYEAQN